MPRFYSFVVVASAECSFQEHLLMLDPGVNTFNLSLDDVEAFKANLEEHGVEIRQCNDLSEPGDDPRLLEP
jgi:hypothetical protein